MKHLKLFENKEELKKYVLMLSDTKLSIIETLESSYSDIGKIYNFKTLYRINEKGIKKQQEYNPNGSLTLRHSFIIKHMIENSNDLQTLINKMEVIYNQIKYNL